MFYQVATRSGKTVGELLNPEGEHGCVQDISVADKAQHASTDKQKFEEYKSNAGPIFEIPMNTISALRHVTYVTDAVDDNFVRSLPGLHSKICVQWTCITQQARSDNFSGQV